MYSGVTNTTSTVSTNYAVFDYQVSSIVCDLTMTPVSAGTATWTLNGNAGSSTTQFNATPYLLSTNTLSATSLTTGISTSAVYGKPAKVIIGTITTSPSASTATMTLKCGGTQ